MKITRVDWAAFLVLTGLLTLSAPAWATTLTFEPGSDRAGWSWLSLQALTQAQWQGDYGNESIPFPSGGYAAVNAYGLSSLALTGPLSTVDGAWAAPFTAFDAWYDPYSAHALTLEGYAGGAFVGATTWALAPGFQYFTTGFTEPVDTLVWRTGADTAQWYVFDDLVLTALLLPVVGPDPVGRQQNPGTPSSGSAVPEAATWLLLGSGVLVLWGARLWVLSSPGSRKR